LKLSNLSIILIGTIAIDAIGIGSVIYMISVFPRHRDILHERQIFPQVMERFRNQPADEARVKSLKLLQDLNHSLDSSVSLIEWLTYSTLTILLLNAGVLVFAFFEFRGTQRPARSAAAPIP